MFLKICKMIEEQIYILISIFLFAIGLGVVITKRNAIFVLMGIELMLNAANINFVAFNHIGDVKNHGQVFGLFVIVIAAAEAAIALAIVLKVVKYYRTTNVDQVDSLKH